MLYCTFVGKLYCSTIPGMRKKTPVKIKAIIHEAAEGGYWAKVPSLPGLYTQGETLEEIEVNIREAVELYLSDDSILVAEGLQENGRVLEIAL